MKRRTWRDEAPELDDWLRRRFPEGGTPEQRLKAHVAPRVLTFVGVMVVVYLAAAAVTTRWDAAPNGRSVLLVVASVVLGAATVVAAGVGLIGVVRLARSERMSRSERELLPALTWAERRELFAELRGRRPVVSGDEVALAVLLRSRRLAVPLGWIGLGQLTVAVGQVLVRPGGLLGALWISTGVVAVALLAVAVRAHLDVRAGARLGLAQDEPVT